MAIARALRDDGIVDEEVIRRVMREGKRMPLRRAERDEIIRRIFAVSSATIADVARTLHIDHTPARRIVADYRTRMSQDQQQTA